MKRPHVKLFSTLRENDEFVAFLKTHPNVVIEGEPEILTIYVNTWLEEHPHIDVLKISEPYWGGTHMYMFLWYYDESSAASATPHEDAGSTEPQSKTELPQ